MAHHRKAIRDRLKMTLTGLASTGANVFQSRKTPVEPAMLPALCIYTLDEGSEVHSMGSSRSLLRNLSLIVQGIAVNNDNLDDSLDQLCLEVETAIGADPAFGARGYDCTLTSTAISLIDSGEAKTGSAIMTFALRYRTLAADPSTNSI